MSRGALAVCGVALLMACIDAPRKLRNEQELAADGLQRVSSRRVGASYVRPGASLAGYSRVRISLDGLEYRRPPRHVRSAPAAGGGNYALGPQQRARFEREFVAAFEHELVESGLYAAATAPGPAVLDVRGRVVDLVVEVPPEAPGSNRTLVRRAGELTMILDAVDSRSGAVLLRMADRRVISQTGDRELYVSSSVSNMAQVRKNLSRWARLLRDRLTELRELDAIPVD
jgi:hypothetical protein